MLHRHQFKIAYCHEIVTIIVIKNSLIRYLSIETQSNSQQTQLKQKHQRLDTERKVFPKMSSIFLTLWDSSKS